MTDFERSAEVSDNDAGVATPKPNTPSLHYSSYSKLSLTYAANAAFQSRIGGKPSSSETKQRSGV